MRGPAASGACQSAVQAEQVDPLLRLRQGCQPLQSILAHQSSVPSQSSSAPPAAQAGVPGAAGAAGHIHTLPTGGWHDVWRSRTMEWHLSCTVIERGVRLSQCVAHCWCRNRAGCLHSYSLLCPTRLPPCSSSPPPGHHTAEPLPAAAGLWRRTRPCLHPLRAQHIGQQQHGAPAASRAAACCCWGAASGA